MEWMWAITPLVALGALLASFLLSSVLFALMTVARAAVEQVADERSRALGPSGGVAAQRLASVLDDTSSHARAVGLLKVTADLVALAAVLVWVSRLRHSGTVSIDAADAAIALALGVPALFVAGVALPMSVASHAGARVIYSSARMVRMIRRGAAPVLVAGRFVDEVVRRLAGAEVKDASEQVTEELLAVVEEGEQRGAIDELDRAMIERVVTFSDLRVTQIMTPRIEIEALEQTNNLGAVIQAIKAIGHSRIPVYQDNLDHILGIFYVKDLMKWLAGDGAHGAGKPFELKSILRPAVFVPETKTVRELLQEMIDKKVHIAMVADEYGGTSGLVTIEDIVEQIIGDIKDEYEPGPVETPDVVIAAEGGRAEIDAGARIADVNEALSPLGVEIPAGDEYDTVGGFVITTLGRIPAKGERFEHERMAITVLEAKPTRVVRVSVQVQGAVEHGSRDVDTVAAAGDSARAAGAGGHNATTNGSAASASASAAAGSGRKDAGDRA